jgi:hypothetical protein
MSLQIVIQTDSQLNTPPLWGGREGLSYCFGLRFLGLPYLIRINSE